MGIVGLPRKAWNVIGPMRGIVSVVCGIILASTALAGHYEVTYAGGGPTAITGPSGTTWYKNYANASGARSGGNPSQDPPVGLAQGQVGPGSVYCSGEITATLQWVNDGGGDNEPPPKSVILLKSASASFQGDTGGCNNGLGDTAVITSLDGHVSGDHYEVVSDPGDQIIRKCSPAAWGSVTTGGGPGSNPASAGVSFSVQATPVRINLAGVWTNPEDSSDKRLMIGQVVQASIDTGGFLTDPTSYNWTFEGGDPFKSYTFTDTLGELKDSSEIATTNATLLAAFRSEDSVNVECTVTIPALNVSVKAEATVATKVPAVTGDDATSGKTLIGRFASMMHRYGGGLDVWTNPHQANDYSESGTIWQRRVTTPTPFSGGEWTFTNMITPTRTRLNPSSVNPINCNWYGQRVLDSEAKYPGRTYPADTNYYYNGDSPGERARDDIVPPDSEVKVNEPMQTYCMYLPPDNGVGRYYVTVNSVKWTWGARVYASTASGNVDNYALDQMVTTTCARQASWDTQPTWTSTFKGGTALWTPPSSTGSTGSTGELDPPIFSTLTTPALQFQRNTNPK